MSSFKCSFTNDIGTPTFEINVKRELIESVNEAKLIIESNNFTSDPVKIKFKMTQLTTVVAYLRLLLRTHMEEVFDESLEAINIEHIGGQIRIYEYPNFHYFNKLNYLREKKYEYESMLFNFSNTEGGGGVGGTVATGTPTVATGTPAVAPTIIPVLTTPAPTTQVSQPDTTYYAILQKYQSCSQKLVKIYKKHQKEVETIKYGYLDKMIGEVSKIFQDLIVLIQDSHEFS